jgi:hypothetical protein
MFRSEFVGDLGYIAFAGGSIGARTSYEIPAVRS